MKIAYNHQSEAIESTDNNSMGIIHHPTGGGKTFIEASIIARDIIKRQELGLTPAVYMINTPRIVLSCQVMNEVREYLINQTQIQAKYFALHSGSLSTGESAAERNTRLKEERSALKSIPMKISSGTSATSIVDAHIEAKRAAVPMIIGATYHSAGRIAAKACNHIDVEIMLNDEAHFLVSVAFMGLVRGESRIKANRVYNFTATLRKTKAIDGVGMNNSGVFGPVIHTCSAARLVTDGILTRVRMHVVDNSSTITDDGAGVDAEHVKQAFVSHAQMVNNIGAKLLVAAKDGSTELNNLVQSTELQELRDVRPQLNVYDLSSKFGARKNGVKYAGGKAKGQKQMMKEIKALGNTDEAIIIHCDMLAEGVDIPGITGVMPLRSLDVDKLLQTIGRALRLHPTDRARLASGEISSSDPDKYLKPYAWVIVPSYGTEGTDRKAEIQEYVELLRQFDFNPAMDIRVSTKHGEAPKVPGKVGGDDTITAVKLIGDVLQTIEDKERADAILVSTQDELVVGF